MPLPITSGGSANAIGPGGGPSGSGAVAPLPSAGGQWVDTGVRKSSTITASVRVKMALGAWSTTPPTVPDHMWGLSYVKAAFNDWRIEGNGWNQPIGGGNESGALVCMVGGPFPTSPDTLEEVPFTVPIGSAPTQWSAVYSFSETIHGLRLGTRITGPGTAQYPVFVQLDQTREYAWFRDSHTYRVATFAGKGGSTQYYLNTAPGWSTTHTPGLTPELLALAAQLDFSLGCHVNGRLEVEITDISIDGELVDTTSLVQGPMTGTGGGDANGTGNAGSPNGGAAWAAAPYTAQFDIDVSKNGGASTGASIDLGFTAAGTFTAPVVRTETHVPRSWATTPGVILSASLNAAWAAAQSPTFRSDDLRIPLDCVKARHSPALPATGYYQPITLTAPTLEVLRPGAAITSSFVTSDAAKLTVSEQAAKTVITVTTLGATATRTLMHHWRAWLAAASGSLDKLIRYSYTKRDLYLAETPTEPEDTWDWSARAWLALGVTAPAAATPTMTIVGAHLTIEDNFNITFADRSAGFVYSETAFTHVYNVPLASGVNPTLYVDLLFPVTPHGPVGVSRVDSITFAGLPVGVTEVTAMNLPVVQQPYFKLDHGPPVNRGDYDCAVAAVDGAQAFGYLPDQEYKTELGLTGGGLRYIAPAESNALGAQDAQMSLPTFWEQLHKVEGWTATWDQTVADAANKDSEGSSLGNGLAQWVRVNELAPYARFSAGTLLPKCSPRAGWLKMANGIAHGVYARWSAGHGAIEGLAATDDSPPARGAAAQTVAVERVTDSVDVGSGATDASGYVVISPIPSNASVNYRWAESTGSGTVLLSPHDLFRLTGLVLSSGALVLSFDRGPDTRLILSHTLTKALNVLRYDDALPEVVSATDNLGGTTVVGVSLKARGSGQWDLIFTAGTTVSLRVSRNQGATWGAAMQIAAGYTNATHDTDEQTGLMAVAVYDKPNTRWLLITGDPEGDATYWAGRLVNVIVTGAKSAAQLRYRGDSRWELAYVTSADAIAIVRSKNVSLTGTAVWA